MKGPAIVRALSGNAGEPGPGELLGLLAAGDNCVGAVRRSLSVHVAPHPEVEPGSAHVAVALALAVVLRRAHALAPLHGLEVAGGYGGGGVAGHVVGHARVEVRGHVLVILLQVLGLVKFILILLLVAAGSSVRVVRRVVGVGVEDMSRISGLNSRILGSGVVLGIRVAVR